MAIQQGMKADWYLGGIYVTLLLFHIYVPKCLLREGVC